MDDEIINENQEGRLNINLSEEVAEGIYTNLAIITHSNSEFVIDFVRVMPNMPQANVKSRILTTPQHAKRLLRALADNIGRFEQQYGRISDPEADQDNIMYSGPMGKA